MACEILYTSDKRQVLMTKVINYIKNLDFGVFKLGLLTSSFPTEVRFNLHQTDDLSDVHKSVIQFYNDLTAVTNSLLARNPNVRIAIESLLHLVETEFHIDADKTQSASDEVDNETKTQDELFDKNRGKLQEHLKEIYGLESHDILMTLDQEFKDLVIEAAYYNSKTGESVDINNLVLNANIGKLKLIQLNKIKAYLDSVGVKYKNSFYEVQQAFYKHIKTLPKYKETLISQHAAKIQDERTDKINIFKQLIETLQTDPNFAKKVVNNLNKYKKSRLSKDLYAGEGYSLSYLAVRKYVLENREDLKSFITDIETETTNLLEATNAYSILSNFDEMLIDKLGNQLSIQDGTKGIEVSNKYSYHQDTAHEIKGWQTSEDIGSEKHTSRFAQAVMSQIRIFSHKTDEYKNRRLDGTSFIVAARHLLDDIIYGNIKIVGNADYVQHGRNRILNAITTFHDNPQVKLQEILQILFDNIPGHTTGELVNNLSNKKLLTDYDLDILYSVYLKVFNKKDPTSFISQEISGQANNALGSGLMQEMAAYVDSNITMDYLETTTDWETGEVLLKVKKKYFNNSRLYKLRKAINSEVNSKAMTSRQQLAKDYELEIDEPSKDVTLYTIKFDGYRIPLKVPNGLQAKILTSKDNRNTVSFENQDFFKMLDKVDLIAFRQKIEQKAELTDEKEKALKSVLKFIDKFLGLNTLTSLGLNTLQVYKSIYEEVNDMENYLMPLVQLAIRAAYINEQYIKAGDQSLAEFLQDDSIYKNYKKNPKSKMFVETYGNVKYTAVSFADKALDMWVDSLSMLIGEASKATTKDGQGNSIPNNSVGKLGGILHYYLHKQRGTNCDSLMFVDDPSAIKSTFHDLEASNIHGDTKSIKQFSCGELFFHSIFNKFWGSYNKTGNVIIQPTVYSDKTTFLNWEIKTDLLKDPDYLNKVIQQYRLTLGTFYQNVYDTTVSKINKLAEYYNQKNNTQLSSLEFLKQHTEASLLALLREYNSHIDQKAAEEIDPEAKKAILKTKITSLEKDKDYRARKKVVKVIENGNEVEKEISYCTFNEILEHNAKVYNDLALLQKALEIEKYNFLQNLIDYNSSFQVLNFLDDISYYTGEKINDKATTKNPIMSTILSTLTNVEERANFFKQWVDAKTGKLILAKQNGKNILGIGGDFNKNEAGMILNPFLDKFFYVEGLLSNNLRMSLTGSEINHPDKAKDLLFKTAQKLDYGDFKKSLNLSLSFDEYLLVQTALKNSADIYEVRDEADKATNPVVKQTLQEIYDRSILKIVNTAQGTQFKRNVIIPATLQYCQQGTKNGVSRKIKCAVIYDEKAPVNNYRGETGKVDSADGSAKINPFQSILENLSLGSQAVGFVKKPIWHSYDAESGTAFLAKFATNTITNEDMRTSMHSSTNLYKMFKRMTNMLWAEAIDLTKPIHMNKSLSEDGTKAQHYEAWFNKVILESQKLFYENKFGEKMQIIKFNKTTRGSDGKVFYYTVEQNKFGENTKVYHVFDKDSNHYTTTSYQEAQNLVDNGYHTINSLFELHAALGGVYCVDSNGNSSEFNNKVVVNFMNNIGTRREGVPQNDIVNLDNYYQPLKEYHIGYALNNSAVKNGAKNVNSTDAWKGDTDLMYFEVDSDGLGMQMNADHDIVGSELTEFSQVIAATSAYGYTYDNCNEIFKGLAKTAFEASKHVLDSVDAFLQQMDSDKKAEAQSALYDAVGRIVMAERSIKDKESLDNIIYEAVLKVFNKNKNHQDDDVKIPFSDPNIYSGFVATLASAITKASIKRKHPGSGCVMVPGYNIVTYFEVGDQKYSHTDMLKKARADFRLDLINLLKTNELYRISEKGFEYFGDRFISEFSLGELIETVKELNLIGEADLTLATTSDSVVFNKVLVDRYLDKLQAEAVVFPDKSYYLPEDVVLILNELGLLIDTVILDTMDKYYSFKNGLRDIELSYNTTIKANYGKGEYEINLKSDSNQKIVLRPNETESGVLEYSIVSYSNLPVSVELINTALQVIPIGSVIKLSQEQIQLLDPTTLALLNTEQLGDGVNEYITYTKIALPNYHNSYRVDVKTPRNLKPSLIRWKYLDENGVEKYMNIFDHPIIKNAFTLKGKLNADYRKQVQQILNDLHEGHFTIDGVTRYIVPGSLENTEAELVMSNIYKEIFGVDNESLQEILEQGELFFIDQIENNVHAPINKIYDVALLKDNGKHTLIKFGEVTPNEYCVEDEFTSTQVIEEKHERTGRTTHSIYSMKGNKPLFKIGEYVDVTGEEADDLYIDNKEVKSKSGKEIDLKLYRINNLTIQKRIDFIRRYKLTTKQINRKTKLEYYTTNVLYKIINKNDLKALYGGGELGEADAHKQIGSLITKLYKLDNYKFVELNPLKSEKHLNQFLTISGYFGWFLQNNTVNPDHKNYLEQLLASLSEPGKGIKKLAAIKKEFYKKEAHKKWISFLDSLKFISSRIPAQTLQSFMTMKCVGWTENTKNMAYVSHFQIYLQGSDYDIDKAYIMGLSYDGNGQYIQWSPLFDFTDVKTLELSKQLPVPENLTLTKTDTGVNINKELKTLIEGLDDKLEPLSYLARIDTLKAKIDILKKINTSNGAIYYTIEESPKLKKVFDMLYSHIKYNIPEIVAESAYKNVASANIYAVSHDIRNRDLGYTAIAMDILQEAAKNSPKGEQAATLNMLNPLTKYVMLYQNIVGKNVISIAANGEKVWFNAYYYWTKLLKEGNTKYLQFQTTLKRVAGRAGIKKLPNLHLLPKNGKTVTTLPDLNPYDVQIKENLLSNFGVDLDLELYAYVDLLISQLLSAATDNAKELILAKINSGNNFARMYVYLIMQGYNFDDIVAFMISPASEFIDSMANPNMFSDNDLKNSPGSAINLAQGIVKSYLFLHGTLTQWEVDETTGGNVQKSYNKNKYIFKRLLNSKYIDEVKKVLKVEEITEIENLDTLMKGFILASINNSEIDITKLVNTKDTEINTYLQYCQNIAYKLNQVAAKYGSIDQMNEDVLEFKKIYSLASEVSSIASAWLGLNLGLPTDELSLLKRFQSMRKVVTDRETSLEIYDSKMFTDSKDPKAIEKAKKYFERAVKNIQNNNEQLTQEEIEQALMKAHDKGLIGTFDIYRYLTDETYKLDMIEYNHIIKGTLNVLDMMEQIPHYKEIMHSLKALAVSKQSLASKSRLINELLTKSDSDYLSDLQLNGIIRYVDKLNAINFAKSLIDPLVFETTIEGFDSYFNKTVTDRINLSTLEGLATFKHWIEHEFLDFLKEKHSDNPLVKHLQRVPENQRDILATDVDLINPNSTTTTRLGFDEIIRGMALFETEPYPNTEHSIADLLQLYNIIVNSNQFGSERLTTAFKACTKPNNILSKFRKFVADQDFAFDVLQDYELFDYYINAAPIVSTGAERFRTEKFIKVNDPVEGYILKLYDDATNSYKEYDMIPPKDGNESREHRLRRVQNFAEYCPFEMPAMAKVIAMFSAVDYEGELTEDILNRIKNIIIDFSNSGKLKAFKDC